jgi:YVTN family beta-propeller protein
VINTISNPSGTDWFPTDIVANPDGTLVYVAWSNLANEGFVSILNTITNTFTTIPISPNSGQLFIAITPDNSKFYVAGFDGALLQSIVRVFNTSDNQLIADLTVGGPPRSVTITPDGKFAYVSLGIAKSIDVIDTSTNTLFTSILTGIFNPGQTAITPDGNFSYISDNSNSVLVVDLKANTFLTAITIPGFLPGPNGIAVTPDGNFVYVADINSPNVAVISTAGNTIFALIPTASGTLPNDVAITPDGNFVYVADFSGTVIVIDTSNNSIINKIPIGTGSSNPVVLTMLPNPPAAPSSAQTLQAIDQSQQLIYQEAQRNYDDILYSGMMGIIEGTFPDYRDIYIIDNETLWTNEITLTPSWCE